MATPTLIIGGSTTTQKSLVIGLRKSSGVPSGTMHVWEDGNTYQKQPNGDWKLVHKRPEPAAVAPEPEEPKLAPRATTFARWQKLELHTEGGTRRGYVSKLHKDGTVSITFEGATKPEKLDAALVTEWMTKKADTNARRRQEEGTTATDLRDPGLLVSPDRGPTEDRPADAPALEGEPREAIPSEEVRLEQPPSAVGQIPDPRPVATPSDVSTTLHKDLLPDIPEDIQIPDDIVNFKNPSPEMRDMFPHQVDAARRVLLAWRNGDGMVLQSEAGLGKTSVALAAMLAHGGKRNLIVVPTAGKHGLKNQWVNEFGKLHNLEIKTEISDAPGFYILSYDELADKAETVDPKTGKTKRVSRLRADLAKEWDTIAFDESHNLVNPESARAKTALVLQDHAKKALYISATPYTNVSDMHYLTKLGEFADRKEFLEWAAHAGAEVEDNVVKNPSSPLPMAAIAATFHVDGKSLKQMANLKGMSSEFGLMGQDALTDDARKTFKTVHDIMDHVVEDGLIQKSIMKALYVSWSRQYWETLKVPRAIELGKKALAEGKQAAFFTSFKTADHRHMHAIPNMLERRADRMLESERPEAQAMAHRLRSEAEAIRSKLTALPKVKSAVHELVQAFGGPDQVSEIHGDTRKKPEVEQKRYQDGTTKVVVATMARGGTGISLHDNKGKASRVQINLSLPWSGREFNQVAGRSHRLGSKSGTTMHWLVGEDANEQHNAAIVAKRLKSMGSLTIGDPELTPDASQLAAFEFRSAGTEADSDDIDDSIKAISDIADAIDNDDVPDSDEATATRDYFREYAEQRRAGRNVLDERFKVRETRKIAEAKLEADRSGEQLKTAGFQVRYDAGIGKYVVGFNNASYAAKNSLVSKRVGGKMDRYLREFRIPAEGMNALAEKLNVHNVKIDMREVARKSAEISRIDKTAAGFREHSLRADPHIAGYHRISGNTYPLRDAIRTNGGRWDSGNKVWIVPNNRLEDVLSKLRKSEDLADLSKAWENTDMRGPQLIIKAHSEPMKPGAKPKKDPGDVAEEKKQTDKQLEDVGIDPKKPMGKALVVPFGSGDPLSFEKQLLEKAGDGEGSRGGKILGHTKSGKPIYAASHEAFSSVAKFNEHHNGWSAEDHSEAVRAHSSTGGSPQSKNSRWVRSAHAHMAAEKRGHSPQAKKEVEYAIGRIGNKTQEKSMTSQDLEEFIKSNGHKYVSRTGSPGNYKYEYAAEENPAPHRRASGGLYHDLHPEPSHTASGKPIYDKKHAAYSSPEKFHEHHKDWSAADHANAAHHHSDASGGTAHEEIHTHMAASKMSPEDVKWRTSHASDSSAWSDIRPGEDHKANAESAIRGLHKSLINKEHGNMSTLEQWLEKSGQPLPTGKPGAHGKEDGDMDGEDVEEGKGSKESSAPMVGHERPGEKSKREAAKAPESTLASTTNNAPSVPMVAHQRPGGVTKSDGWYTSEVSGQSQFDPIRAEASFGPQTQAGVAQKPSALAKAEAPAKPRERTFGDLGIVFAEAAEDAHIAKSMTKQGLMHDPPSFDLSSPLHKSSVCASCGQYRPVVLSMCPSCGAGGFISKSDATPPKPLPQEEILDFS